MVLCILTMGLLGAVSVWVLKQDRGRDVVLTLMIVLL